MRIGGRDGIDDATDTVSTFDDGLPVTVSGALDPRIRDLIE